MKLNGSQILCEVLVEQGVDTISDIRAARFSIFTMRCISTATASGMC